MGDPEAPAPEARPRPAPLPIGDSPEARGSARGVWIAALAAVVAFLALACACCALAPRVLAPVAGPLLEKSAKRMVEDFGPRMWPGVQALYWCDGGRYAVAQVSSMSYAGSRMTILGTVVVHDMDTGTTRVLPDHTIIAVEPHSPRVWMRYSPPEPPDLESDIPTNAPSFDQAWDAVYATGAPAAVWELSEPGIATSTALAWADWPNSAGTTAQVEVDAATGAASGVRFTRAAEASASVEGSVSGRFEPLGWSPDGEYFAMVSLQPIREFRQPPDDITVAEAEEAAPNRVLVIDARTGRVVASRGLGYLRWRDLHRNTMWDGRAGHVLLCLVESRMREGDSPGVDRDVLAVSPLAESEATWLFLGGDGIGIDWPWGSDRVGFAGQGAADSYVLVSSQDGRALWTLRSDSTTFSARSETGRSDELVSPRSDVLAFSTSDYRRGSLELGRVIVATSEGTRTIHTMRMEGMPDYSGLVDVLMPSEGRE